ncbi:MAG: PDZ domain-containing protein [Rhodospirillales bacterium]|nr:PDZ domain-containing protein [Rhodospirillales bacterium]
MFWRVLPVLFVVACTSPDDERFVVSDDTGRVFSRAYEQVADLYIEPKLPADAAWPGLAKLVALDPRLQLERTGDSLLLKREGTVVERLPRPADADARAWGAATSAMIGAARRVSPTIDALDRDKLEQTVFEGIVGSLDKYSRYAPPSVARDQRASRDGFGGIGIQLDREDLTRVVKVMPGTPAHRAGLMAEDRIAKIDGVPTDAIEKVEITRRLRGPVDSSVEVTVARAGLPKPLAVTMKRAFIIVPTVEEQREDDIVIFKVSGFNHSTAQQLADRVAAARREMGPRLRGIVLDLRGNPGGLLDQSVSVADLFIGETGPIVSTRGRNPASQQYFRAAPDDIAGGLPLVALVDGGSASAAEIVAAALQDTGRAVVVGSASYGKGTVQTVLRLPNDGELTITWARLISPAGYSLNEHGVVPTVCTSGLGSGDEEVARAVKRGLEASLQRASLDEDAWIALRKTCPGMNGEPRDFELRVAKRLLSDRRLYTRVLHPRPPSFASSRAESTGAP